MKKLFLFLLCCNIMQFFAMQDPKQCLITDAINTMNEKLHKLNDIEELRKLSKDWHHYCMQQIASTSDSSIKNKLKESIVSMNNIVIDKLYFNGLYKTTIKYIDYVLTIRSDDKRLIIIKKECEQTLKKNRSKNITNKRKRPLQPPYIASIFNKRQKVERDIKKETRIEKINKELIDFVKSLNKDVHNKIEENRKILQPEDICRYMLEVYKDVEVYMKNFNNFEYDQLETEILNNFSQATNLLLLQYLKSDNDTVLKKAINLVTFGCNIPFRYTSNKSLSLTFKSLIHLHKLLIDLMNKTFPQSD